MSYRMSLHAKERAQERLNIPMSTANEWARKRLVGKLPTGKTGNGLNEYEVENVTFIVDETKREIVTVYKSIDNNLVSVVEKALNKELVKSKKALAQVSRNIYSLTATLYKELSSELEKLARTKNPRAKKVIMASVTELNDKINTYNEQLKVAEKSYKIMQKQASKYISL